VKGDRIVEARLVVRRAPLFLPDNQEPFMKLRLLALSSLATCAVIVACSGDDPETAPTTTDGGTDATTTPDPDSSTEPVDSGAPTGEEDGGLITDVDGGNPDDEPDGGLVLDAGPDGGTCGPASGNGATFSSACSSIKALALGGKITPGTYDLTGFTVTGTLAYCGAYVPGTYSGRLDVASDGVNGFILGERVSRSGVLQLFPNRSYTATAAGSFLTVAQTCGVAVKSTSWGYTVTSSNGKPVIVYTHDSGSATVRYRWTMR
jgi:hypothetical protein